jgi:glycosyltransferase involved in cell wall biosynthesis
VTTAAHVDPQAEPHAAAHPAGLPQRPSLSHLAGPTAYPPVWVVVPCHNEAGALPATLDALAAQRGPALTVLVVDNASTDGTAEVAAAWARRVAADGRLTPGTAVALLREDQKGVGAAVDTGFRAAIAAGATHLLRTDADTLPDPTWAQTAVSALGPASVGPDGWDMVTGVSHARPDQDGLLWRALFLAAFWAAAGFGVVRPAHRPLSRTAPHRYLMTAGHNMAVRPEAYLACGGMPRQGSPTDRLFANRIRHTTSRIRRVPAMRVRTSTRRLRGYGLRGTARWYLFKGAPADLREDVR